MTTLPGTIMATEVIWIGEGCFLWSADLACTYHQLCACLLLIPHLRITHNKYTYFNIAPSFGCRTSSTSCAQTTNAVVYLLRKKGYYALCYLDDFVRVAPTLEADMLQVHPPTK